jgi:hypothetical protein
MDPIGAIAWIILEAIQLVVIFYLWSSRDKHENEIWELKQSVAWLKAYPTVTSDTDAAPPPIADLMDDADYWRHGGEPPEYIP